MFSWNTSAFKRFWGSIILLSHSEATFFDSIEWVAIQSQHLAFLYQLSYVQHPIKVLLSTPLPVIGGSSQWDIGRNVTWIANIEQIGENYLIFPVGSEGEYKSIINKNFHSYIPLNRFKYLRYECTLNKFSSDTRSALWCMPAFARNSTRWTESKSIVDIACKHACGNPLFFDNKLLLERNGMSIDFIASYLIEVVNAFLACRSPSAP